MTIVGDRLHGWFERALDLSGQRGKLLAGNIANVDTPGYVPEDMDFRAALRRELSSHGPTSDLPAMTRQLRTDVPPRLDGNQVDLDKEVTLLASNRTFHELATEVVSRRIAMLRYSIDEGGR